MSPDLCCVQDAVMQGWVSLASALPLSPVVIVTLMQCRAQGINRLLRAGCGDARLVQDNSQPNIWAARLAHCGHDWTGDRFRHDVFAQQEHCTWGMLLTDILQGSLQLSLCLTGISVLLLWPPHLMLRGLETVHLPAGPSSYSMLTHHIHRSDMTLLTSRYVTSGCGACTMRPFCVVGIGRCKGKQDVAALYVQCE